VRFPITRTPVAVTHEKQIALANLTLDGAFHRKYNNPETFEALAMFYENIMEKVSKMERLNIKIMLEHDQDGSKDDNPE
jgi:diaminopimelate decarboxylase